MISKKIQFILDNMEYWAGRLGRIRKGEFYYSIFFKYETDRDKTEKKYIMIEKYRTNNGNIYYEGLSKPIPISEVEYALLNERKEELRDEFDKQLSLELFGE